MTAKKIFSNIDILLRKLRNIFLAIVVFFTAIAATIIILVSLDSDNIQNLLLNELNRRTTTEIRAGQIEFSLLGNFPMASVSLHNVYIEDNADQAKDKPLAHVESIHLRFNILDFFRREYTIRHLAVHNGFFHPTIYPGGHRNYIFWETDTTKASEGLRFDIKHIDVSELQVTFSHIPENQLASIDIHKMAFSLPEDTNTVILASRGQLAANKIIAGNIDWSGKVQADTDLLLSFDDQGGIRSKESRLNLNGHDFVVDGYFVRRDNSVYADASIVAKRLDSQKFLGQLPESWRRIARPYQISGLSSVDVDIKGMLDDAAGFDLRVGFSLRDGSLLFPQQGIQASIHQVKGYYAKKAGSDFPGGKLALTDIRASGDDATIQGELELTDFTAPWLSFDLNAGLPSRKLLSFYPHHNLHHAGGRVTMDIRFNGAMSKGRNFSRGDLLEAQLSGEVSLHDVSFSMDERNYLPYHGINASMSFSDNALKMRHLEGKVGGSDFSLTGSINNILPYLFLPGETALIQADLSASRINMDEILQQHTSEADTLYRLTLPSRLRMDMKADIGALSFRDFLAEDITGNMRIADSRFFADHLELQAMEGHVVIAGIVDGRSPGYLDVSCQAALSDVDIHQLFLQTGNFGQDGISHEHLHGRVTAGMEFSARWSTDLIIDWSSMETSASLTINEGRLVNYHPLIALGRYIRTGDLSDVSFSTLENEIHILNREIVIPQMEIASSALDLQLSGIHTFDNEIDYRLQVLLSDVLAREHRERRNPQEQYGEIIDDGLGRTTLFLRLTGDFHNPQFSYDHQGVREKLRDDLREERQNLRQILREEFRFLSREPREQSPEEEKKDERLRKQEEGEFIIEWDELP